LGRRAGTGSPTLFIGCRKPRVEGQHRQVILPGHEAGCNSFQPAAFIFFESAAGFVLEVFFELSEAVDELEGVS
jgi:hypothetical protein